MKDKSAKMQLLDEWRGYEQLAEMLRNAYYAAKYSDWESAIQHLKSGEYTGLSEKLVDRLIEAIRAEAGKEATNDLSRL